MVFRKVANVPYILRLVHNTKMHCAGEKKAEFYVVQQMVQYTYK
jgi:hypothetical protein